jgi:hypothetical protein
MKNLLIILIVSLIGSNGFGQESTIQQQWDNLSDSISGCLVGFQNGKGGKYSHRASTFDMRREWKLFWKNDTTALANFLVQQLSDTARTKTHVCPFVNATRGELAIYCLQRLYRVNWYSLSDDVLFKDGAGYQDENDDFVTGQTQLLKVLSTEAGVKLLGEKWRGEINKKD